MVNLIFILQSKPLCTSVSKYDLKYLIYFRSYLDTIFLTLNKKKRKNMHIILYDGICHLCNYAVTFVIRRDKSGYFYFVSLQSQRGKDLVKKYGLEKLDSIILIENDKAYIQSDAVLEIVKHLDGRWAYLSIFRFIPKLLRDGIYTLVARYRYTIFGKAEECIVPTPEIESRFLD